jgi:SAM-dependent methyltransferase
MFNNNYKRALRLLKLRGLSWLLISIIPAIPIIPKLFSRLIGWISTLNTMKLFAALSGVHINQTWPERKDVMEGVISDFMKKKEGLSILEIGTWMGEGSTQVWLNILEESPSNKLTVIDKWAPYLLDTKENRFSINMNSFHRVAINSLLNIIKNKNLDDSVNIYRGDSKNILPVLQDKLYDIIYIDGDHTYKNVNFEIREARRLIKPGGIIAGDDLEVPLADLSVNFLRKNRSLEFITNEKGQAIHPGVVLAVLENFSSKSINQKNGFWYVFC